MSKRIFLITIAAFLVAGGSILAQQAVRLNGAGASFPNPIYQKWVTEFQKKTGVEINYQSVGSGAGIGQVTEGKVDFGASDGPMNPEELQKFHDKRGFGVSAFPDGDGRRRADLQPAGRFSSAQLHAGSAGRDFPGQDQEMERSGATKANPGVKLPDGDIVVVHRSDGSGTTYVFTDYLSKVSPEWKSKVGNANVGEVAVGLGGKGNEGVAGQVKQTPNSIGYVELSYAMQNKMAYRNVKKAAGKFVQPTRPA